VPSERSSPAAADRRRPPTAAKKSPDLRDRYRARVNDHASSTPRARASPRLARSRVSRVAWTIVRASHVRARSSARVDDRERRRHDRDDDSNASTEWARARARSVGSRTRVWTRRALGTRAVVRDGRGERVA